MHNTMRLGGLLETNLGNNNLNKIFISICPTSFQVLGGVLQTARVTSVHWIHISAKEGEQGMVVDS